MTVPPAEWRPLDLPAVAARTGLAEDTVRTYLARTRARVSAGDEIRAHDFPLPDDQVSGVPVYYAATIDRWLAARPGRGAGGGRPKNDERAAR